MSAGESVVVRLAVVVYRRSLALLPRDFRRDFADELAACFEAIAGEARRTRGRSAVAGVTLRSLLDLLSRAPKQHLTAARAGALGAGGGWAGAWQDVRHALRRMRRRPTFAAASVVTLGLGITAATSVFSLVHGVVLSPLPYPDSDRIVVVDHGGAGIGIDWGLGVTYGFFRFYRERSRLAESLAMYTNFEMTLTGEGEPVRIPTTRATPSLLEVLRTPPLLGRWFTEVEGETGAAVTVLSHRLWRERLGADPSVVGRVIGLDGVPHEVVGVMPASFSFPLEDTRLWRPLQVPATGIGGWNRLAVARLKAAAAPADLEAELASLLPVLRETNDDPARVTSYLDEAKIQPRIVALKDEVVGDVRATLWILLGTVGFVLLIAVANVANLFLVRAEEGQQESAVRTALGADRARLTRGFLTETLLLAVPAGVLGVAASAAAIGVLRRSAPVNVPRLEEVGLHPVVLAVALVLSLAAALLIGLIPAFRRTADLSASLKEGSRRTTASQTRLRGRNVLVAAQMALALVLLIGSGLLLRTFQELRSVDLGFSTRQALTFEIGLPATSYESRAAAKAFHDELHERLAAIPGVETVGAVAACLPLSNSMCWGETLEAEGHPTPEGQVPPVTGMRAASTGYFDAIGIPVRGRLFTPADAAGAGGVAILSEAAARAYFGDDDPIGRRIRVTGGDSPWHTIVGVARDVRGRVATDDFLRVIYTPVLPEAQEGPPPSTMSYVLRTTVPPASVASAARRAVATIDPLIPLANVRPLREIIDQATAPTAFAMTLVALAAAMALLLGAIGVYAVLAYSVSRRAGEIGVRMALGARAPDVRRLILRQGGRVVLIGIGVGLVGALALTRLMRGMLFGVSATDPLSYALVTAVMLVVAGVALWLPAHRASRVDPLESLRNE